MESLQLFNSLIGSTNGTTLNGSCGSYWLLSFLPQVYVSDGGLIECLGVLMLLRRRMPLIICSDACEVTWFQDVSIKESPMILFATLICAGTA